MIFYDSKDEQSLERECLNSKIALFQGSVFGISYCKLSGFSISFDFIQDRLEAFRQENGTAINTYLSFKKYYEIMAVACAKDMRRLSICPHLGKKIIESGYAFYFLECKKNNNTELIDFNSNKDDEILEAIAIDPIEVDPIDLEDLP